MTDQAIAVIAFAAIIIGCSWAFAWMIVNLFKRN